MEERLSIDAVMCVLYTLCAVFTKNVTIIGQVYSVKPKQTENKIQQPSDRLSRSVLAVSSTDISCDELEILQIEHMD